jgi:hypothetical protein
MSVESNKNKSVYSVPTIKIPLITHNFIVQKYDIDFCSYIEKLIKVNKFLTKKISIYKGTRKNSINKLNLIEKIRYRLEILIPRMKISKIFSEIEILSLYIRLITKLRETLWTTPLFTHTIHNPTKKEKNSNITSKISDYDEFDQESTNSILLSLINQYERIYEFKFTDNEVINELKILRDSMGKMWLYFKERQFRYAVNKLNEISSLSVDKQGFNTEVNDYLDKLIPIFSIYELFNRSLVESVYPESIPNTNRVGASLAKFFASKYNPIGINLMNLFNRLAFQNWIFFINKKKLSINQFFNFILRLPIWKNIPENLKRNILNNSNKK